MKALEEERDVIRARGIKLEEGRRTGSKATPWEAPTPTSYCNSPGREERKGQAANRPGKGMQAGPHAQLLSAGKPRHFHKAAGSTLGQSPLEMTAFHYNLSLSWSS